MRCRRGCEVAFATVYVLHSALVYGAVGPHLSSIAHARYGAAQPHKSSTRSRLRGDGLLLAKAQNVGVEPDLVDMARRSMRNAMIASSGFFQAAVSGGFATTVMFPVDMAKTRMQACAQLESQLATHQRTYSGTFQTMRKVLSQEGPISLYRGLKPVLLGSAPEIAVQITSYEIARKHLANGTRDPAAFDIQFFAGMFAGFTHTLVSCPMEVLKVRGQVLGSSAGGMVGAVREMGFRGLFQGLSASWAMHIPFSCIYFPAYSHFKGQLDAQGQPPLVSSLVAGLTAGVLAAAPTTPCDVVKTRMQNPSAAPIGLVQTVRTMYAQEGVQAFFTGVKPRVGRSAPYLALSLTGYELLQRLFPPPASPSERVAEPARKT